MANQSLEELYGLYKQNGNSETFEQFQQAMDMMGEEGFYAYLEQTIPELKKKELTDPEAATGNPSSTPTSPIPDQMLEQFSGKPMNQVEPMYQQGAMPDPNSSASVTTPEMPSTASASAAGAYSSTESGNAGINPDFNFTESPQNPQEKILSGDTGVRTFDFGGNTFTASPITPKREILKDPIFGKSESHPYESVQPSDQPQIPDAANATPYRKDKTGMEYIYSKSIDAEDAIRNNRIDVSQLNAIGDDGNGTYYFTPKNDPDTNLVYKNGQLQIAEREVDENGNVIGEPKIYGRDFRITPNGSIYYSDTFSDDEKKLYDTTPKKINNLPYYDYNTEFSYDKLTDISGKVGAYGSIDEFNNSFKSNPDYELVTNPDGTEKKSGNSLVFKIKTESELNRANDDVKKLNDAIDRENEKNGLAAFDPFGNKSQYILDQRLYSSLEAGAEASKKAAEPQIKEFGKDTVDRYGGIMTEEEMRNERLSRLSSKYSDMGYTPQQAAQYAEQEIAGQQMRKFQEGSIYIENIIGTAEKSQSGEYRSSLKRNDDDVKFTESERAVWNAIRQNGDFGDFMKEEGSNIFGTPGKDLEINAATTTLRKRMVDAYQSWRMEKIQDTSHALMDYRGNQKRLELRKAIEQDDTEAIGSARKNFTTIASDLSVQQKKAKEIADQTAYFDRSFDILHNERQQVMADYADHKNSTLGNASVWAKSFGNGVMNVASDIVGGVMTLGAFNDRVGTFVNAFDYSTKDAWKTNIGSTTEHYEIYQDASGKKYKKIGADVFDLDAKGNITYNERLTYDQGKLSDFKKVDEGNDFSAAGTLRMVTNQVGMMAAAEFTAGGLAASSVGKVGSIRYLRNASKAIDFFGKESVIARNLNLFNTIKGTYSSLAWGDMVAKSNFVAGKEAGLTNEQAYWNGLFQTAGTMAMIHISPDAKFFSEYRGASQDIMRLISQNKWELAGNKIAAFAKTVGHGMLKENIQENSEQALSDTMNFIANSLIGKGNDGKDRFETFKFDTYAQTVKDTSLLTFVLGSSNSILRQQNSAADLKLNGLSKLQQYIVAAQVPNVDQYLNDQAANSLLGVSSQQVAETQAVVDKVRKYTGQIPPAANLKIEQTEQVVLAMEQIDKLKKQLSQTGVDAVKEAINNQITEQNQKIADILSSAKNNANENAQPAQEQETAQGNTETTTEEPAEAEPVPNAPTPKRPDGSGGDGAAAEAEGGVENNSKYSRRTYSLEDVSDDDYSKLSSDVIKEFIELDNEVNSLSLYSDEGLKRSKEINKRINELRSENNLNDLQLNHGTPHDFEEFVTNKIGTGEGNQAFGWGLYFTQSKGIAERYAKVLDKNKNGIVYSVRIKDGKVKNFIEWRDIVEIDKVVEIGKRFSNEDRKKYDEYLQQSESDKDHFGLFQDVFDSEDGSIYSYVDNVAFGNIYNDLSDALGQQRASEILQQTGYSGIKYKSNKGKGNAYNFVVFDANDISITAKNKLDGTEIKINQDGQPTNQEQTPVEKIGGTQQTSQEAGQDTANQPTEVVGSDTQSQETTEAPAQEEVKQVFSEQGANETEQSVTTDLDRKEVYAQDIANGNVVSFVYENEEDVPSVFKDRITSDSLINGKRTIRVSMSKSEADDLLKNNTPTSETEQNTQQSKEEVKQVFSDKTTGIVAIDDLLNDDGYNFFYKGKTATMEYMSPDEYLQRVRDGQKTTDDQNITPQKAQGIKDAINSGNVINAPFLDYTNGRFDQEGRNRAAVAKEMGIEQIPVVVAKDVTFDDKVNRARALVTDEIKNGASTLNEAVSNLRNKLHRDGVNFILDEIGNPEFEQTHSSRM